MRETRKRAKYTLEFKMKAVRLVKGGQAVSVQRQKITDGSATAKALDYSLKRWGPLTQFLDDGKLPIDNNWIENQIRPIAIGRNN